MKLSKTIISMPEVPAPESMVSDSFLDALDARVGDDDQVDQQTLVVRLSDHGKRMDVVLTDYLVSFSRSYVQQRVEAGDVKCNGKMVMKPSTKVAAGDTLDIALRETAQVQAFKPQDIALDVVFQDEHLLVLSKPMGLVVHPAPGNWQGTLMNGLLHHYPEVLNLPRAGIVHRLDKDTSGLMVTAKTRATMDALVKMIANRDMHREYLALTDKAWVGAPMRQVNSPIGRDPHNRVRMAVVDMGRDPGKSARTDFYRIDSTVSGCLVHCILHTGRTHQIRVHMAAIGMPLLGDQLYGGAVKHGMSHQALHAFRLGFVHPVTGAPMVFTKDASTEFRRATDEMGLRYNLPTPRDGAMAIV